MNRLQINTSSKNSIIESFKSIATDFLLNKRILINEYEYCFVDIEFYYMHENHKDEYADGIKHLKPKGEFEIHRYGVDISLGNSKESFGGILLKGLWDLQTQNIIPKSQIIRTLYNSFMQGENRFDLITKKSPWNEIFRSTRSNLGIADTDAKREFFN